MSCSACLDAPLDLADRREVFVDLAAVRRAQIGRQRRGALGDQIEDAPAVLQAPRPRLRREASCRGRRTAVRRPAAGWSRAASASSARATPGCWCRRTSSPNRSCRPCASRRSRARARKSACGGEMLRRNLVDRDAVLDVGAGGFAGMHAGEIGGGRARVVAGTVAERIAVLVREAREHDRVLAEPFERLQTRASTRTRRPAPSASSRPSSRRSAHR